MGSQWPGLLFAVLVATMPGDGGTRSAPGASGTRTEQQVFERLLKQYHQRAFAARQAGGPEEGPFRPGEEVPARTEADRALIPENVLDAHDSYWQGVERPDWGSVRVFRCSDDLLTRPFWIVWVRTDGDDGWVELFDAAGLPRGAGRHYLELVAWGSTAELRAMVPDRGFPEALADRSTRTIWARRNR